MAQELTYDKVLQESDDILRHSNRPVKSATYLMQFTREILSGFEDVWGSSFLANTTKYQKLAISEGLSKELGERWVPIPFQLGVTEFFDGQLFNALKDRYFWFDNEETLQKRDGKVYLLRNQKLANKSGFPTITGERKEITIVNNRVTDTLARIGEYQPRDDVRDYGIDFDDNGIASLWSDWAPDDASFCADARRPSLRNSHGLSAFARVSKGKKVAGKLKMIKVSEAEYREMQERLSASETRARELEEKLGRYEALAEDASLRLQKIKKS